MNARFARAMLLALSLCCATSCDRCGDEVVAEITTAKGEVQRDTRAYPGQFANAGVSETLHLGDALRTGARSEAELKLFPDGVARIEERTLVRFMSERPADGVERLTIEEGVIELDAMAVDLELDTGHGIARVKQGSRIRVRASDADDVQLDVLVGRVQIERPGQADTGAKAGETLTLAAPSVAQPATTTTVDPPPEVVADLTGTPETPSPEPLNPGTDTDLVKSIDFKLAGLENAVIHATALPVDIALPLDPCPEGASIALGAGAKRRTLHADPNRPEVSLRLKAGVQKLRIRCGSQTRELSLRVVRDAATQELPRTAPAVDVAADGRRYTVRYQNLLPSLDFAWPNAEPSARYVLIVKRGQNRTQRFESNTPEKRLKSGELAEGEYTFTFQTANGQSSAESRLRIAFDNTARSAYLSEPAENSARANTIRVVGGALARSEVSVAGVPVALDNQGRFEATLPHATSENAIAIRVSHPSTGVHYYVRRLR